MILDQHGNPYKKEFVNSKRVSKGNPNPIIARIANTFKDRSRKEIQRWRQSIVMAEHPTNPNRSALMDLVHDLSSDGHLKSQMLLRKSSVLNTTFCIKNVETGEIDEEVTKLINKKWFFNIISTCTDSFFYGHSLLDILEISDTGIKTKLVPRRHVIPERQVVVPDFTKPSNLIYYNDPIYSNWLFEFGEEDDLGILCDIVPNLIWKRNVLQSWAEFCERFGIPMVTATTVRSTPEAINQIEEMLFQLGEAAVGVFPEGTNIDFKEASRTDAYMVFDKKIERCNSEISKRILGGTMVSDNGSSKSQSEVHERNLDDKISASDRREIEFFVNDTLLPILRYHGFKIGDGFEFKFDSSQELELSEHWTIVESIMSNPNLEVDYDWVSKTFNVPFKVKENIDPNGSTEKKKSKVNPITQHIDDRYPTACNCKTIIQAVGAIDLGILNQLQNLLIQLIFDEKDTSKIVGDFVSAESKVLIKGLMEGYGNSISIEWNAPDHLMLAMMETNIYNFASHKTEARLASLRDLMIDYDNGKIREFNEFKELATKKVEAFNNHWLKTEYNLAVATGQTSAAFLRAWEQKDDFPYVQYMTAGDANVRNSHAALNGKIFNLKNDAEARKLWPPNDYGCRCDMVEYPFKPHSSGVTKGIDGIGLLGDKFLKSDFAINRADVKQVFLKNQFYVDSNGVEKEIGKMTFKDWELKSIKDLSGHSSLKLDESITEDNVKELYVEVGKNKMKFNDHLKRQILLDRKVFNTHTTGEKYLKEKRHQLFPNVESVLSNPSEVWLQQYGVTEKVQLTYLKFYDKTSVVVNVEIDQNGYSITTWYEMKKDESEIRKGLLIYNKP